MKTSTRSLRKSLKRLGERFSRRRSSRQLTPPRSRFLQLEPLEQRQMLSITVDSPLDNMDGGDGLTTLREAIDQASSGETIVFADNAAFAADPVIDLTEALGQLVITKNLTIDGSDVDGLTIDAHEQSRVFIIGNSATVTISDLTITRGYADETDEDGGGIYTGSNTTLSLSGVTITDCEAENHGGGIYAYGTLNIDASTILSENQADRGGAIYASASLHVTGATIGGASEEDSNTASYGGGIYGGCVSEITIDGSAILSNNTATARGGAVCVYSGGDLDVLGSVTFSGNEAGVHGGAIYMDDCDDRLNTISGATFSGNHADSCGGAINTYNSTLEISDTSITGNWSDNSSGGGIFGSGDGKTTITDSSVTGNDSGNRGGGIYASHELHVTDTTITGNDATNYGGGIYGTDVTITGSGTLIDDNHAVVYNGGGIYISGSSKPLNITDATISNNTANLYGGGIYNLGDGCTVNISGATIDNNNAVRGGGIYGYNDSIITLTNSATVSNNTASYSGGGIYGCTGSELTANASTISGNESQGYHGGGIYACGTLTISDSLLSGNKALGSFQGGAIYAVNALTLTDSTLSDNTAGGYGGGICGAYSGSITIQGETYFSGNKSTNLNGGAVASKGSSLTVTGTATFDGNEADAHGGAIFLIDCIDSEDPDKNTISGATVSGNHADSWGGAICLDNSTLKIFDTSIVGNWSAGSGGGGIHSGSSLTVVNSVVANNTAANYGGGIYGSNITLTNATIAGNYAGNSGGGICAIDSLDVNNSIVSLNEAGSDHNIYQVNGTPTGGNNLTDDNLAREIRQSLGISESEILLLENVTGAESLTLDSNVVTTLEGLQNATSLETLRLVPADFSAAAGELTDTDTYPHSPLSPLADLPNLESLTLQRTGLDNADFDDLGSATPFEELVSLDLTYNAITAVPSSVADLPELAQLSLYENPLVTSWYTEIEGKPISIDIPSDHPENAQTIEDLAEALYYNPIEMYEWVVNNIEFQPYAGSMKGPLATLQTKAGNSWDTASLLAALYDEAGISSTNIRYRYGEIATPIETAMEYTGTITADAAEKVLDAAGLNAEQITCQSDDMMKFRHARLQVKFDGVNWTDLDASWKFKDYQTGLSGLLDELPFYDDPESSTDLVDQYFSSVRKELAYEFYESEVRDYLAENYPGLTVADVAYEGPILTQSFSTSLPFMEYSPPSTPATIPTEYKHRIRVTYGDIDETFALSDMSLDRLTIYPDPDNGDYVTPCLMRDGVVIESSTSVLKTTELTLTVEHFDGDGDAVKDGEITRDCLAGQLLAIALDANQISEELINEQRREVNLEAINEANGDTIDMEILIGGTLHLAGLTYFYETGYGEEVIAGLTNGQRVASSVSSGIVVSDASLRANEDMDQQIPYLPEFMGMDIQRDEWTILPIDDDWSTNNDRLRLAGYTASAMKAGIWEELTNSDGISAIKSLQMAGNDVVTISFENVGDIATLLADLSDGSTQTLEDDVVDLVKEIVLNEQDFLDFDETDTGSNITVSENTVSYSGISTSGTYSLAKHETATYFSGNFEHWIDVNCPAATDDSNVYVWSLAKDHDGNDTYFESNEDRIGVRFEGTSTDPNLVLFEYVGATATEYTDSCTAALSTDYYLVMERSGSTLTCYIYDNAARTGTPATLQLTLQGGTPDYSALYLAYANGTGTQSGTISNLELRNRTVAVPKHCTNIGDPAEQNKMWKGVGYIGANFEGMDCIYRIYGGVNGEYEEIDGGWAAYNTEDVDSTISYVPDATRTAASDLIDVASGTVCHNEVDLSIPNLGIPLEFSRHYKSDQTVSGLAGAPAAWSDRGMSEGWSFSYSDCLEEQANDDLIWYTGDGDRLLFEFSQTDVWTPPDAMFGTLTYSSPYYTWEDTAGNKVIFNSSKQLYRKLDRYGNGIQVNYDAADPDEIDTVQSVVDGTATSERQLEFTYTSDLITRITDQSGRYWGYTYDGNGRLDSVTTKILESPLTEAVVEYTYYTDDARLGLLETVTDPVDGVTTFTYYANRRGFEVKDTLGNSDTFTYNIFRDRTAVTDKGGNTTYYTHDDEDNIGCVTEVLHSDRTSVETTFSEYLRTSVTDEYGQATSYEYDDDGNLTRTVGSLGIETVMEYTDYANVSRISKFDQDDAVSILFENRTNCAVSDGGKTVLITGDTIYDIELDYTVTPNTVIEFDFCSGTEGDEHSILVADGVYNASSTEKKALFQLYGTDEAGNHGITAITVDNTTYNNYPGNAEVKRYSIPVGQSLVTGSTATIWFWNDDDNVPISGESEFSNVRIYESTQFFTYNEDGSLAEATDAGGNTTAYTYPETNLGLPDTITRPKGTETSGDDDDYVTKLQYNNAGQVTEKHTYLEPGVWVTEKYTYDTYGRGTMETKTDRYYTDDNGDPIGAAGNVTDYTYDLFGRIKKEELPDPDGDGPLSRPTTEYEYDAIGNLIERTEVIAGEDDLVTAYEYDLMGQLIETTNTDGTIETRYYDADGHIVTSTDALGRTTEYQYDDRGRCIATILPDGSILRTAYDGGGRVVSQTDALGNTTNYKYDVLGRKIEEMLPDPDGSGGDNRPTTYYEYDANGNLIAQTLPQADTSWADDANVVAYWQLENDTDGVVNIADEACDDGDLVNDAVLAQGALQLPGNSAAKIAVSDNDPLDIHGDANMTISAWVYADSLQDYQYVVAKRNGDDHQYGLVVDGSGALGLYTWDTNDMTAYSELGKVTTGQWHHVLATRQEGGQTQLYVDGVECTDAANSTSGAIPDGTTDVPFYIGARGNGYDTLTYSWHGRIADVVVLKKHVTADEAVELMLQSANTTTRYEYDALDRMVKKTEAPVMLPDGEVYFPTTAYYYDAHGNLTGTIGSRRNSDEYNIGVTTDGSLVGHWQLDEGNGLVANGSVAGLPDGQIVYYEGDPEGTPTWVDGIVGSALKFTEGPLASGSLHAALQVTGLAVNTDAGAHNTVAFWMKWNGSNHDIPILWPGGQYLCLSDNQIAFGTGTGGLFATPAFADLANQWVHVTAVFVNGVPGETDGVANCKIYVNGVSQPLIHQGAAPVSKDVQTTIELGGPISTSYYNRYNGLLDNIQIYSRELTPEEIASLLRNERTLYEYDALDRKVTDILPLVTLPDGEKCFPEKSYYYDANDNMISMVDEQRNAGEHLTTQSTDSGLIGHWMMNSVYDDSGTTKTPSALKYDETAVGPDGTLVSGTDVSLSTEGIYGNGMLFESTDDSGGEVSITGLSGYGDQSGDKNTLAFWMKWDGVKPLGQAPIPICWGDIALIFHEGYFGFNTGNSDVLGVDFDPLKDRWVHVAAVFYNYNAGTGSYGYDFSLYINGELQTLTQYSSPNTGQSVSGSLTLGNESDPNEFGGLIDEVQVYNRELTADEVQALLDTEKSTYWRYDALGRVIEEVQSPVVDADGTVIRPTTRYRYDAYGNLAATANARGSAGEFNTDESLSDDLIAYWKLDESDGTSLANEVDGSPEATITQDNGSPALTVGLFNNGLSSNGSDGYASAAEIPNLNEEANECNTVSFWMKWDGTDADRPFRWITNSYVFELELSVDNQEAQIGFTTGQGDYLGTALGTIAINEWVHITAVFVNGTPTTSNCSIYVNGVEKALTLSGTPASHTASSTDSTVEFGGHYNSSYQFNGLLDDLQIYNRELATDEVASLYNRQWTMQYVYDKRGRATSVTDAEGGLTETEYDAVGNTVTTFDALGNVSWYEYDSRNRLIRQTLPDPDGYESQTAPVTDYEYDANGNVLSVTDALDNTTFYRYDALGRRTYTINANFEGTYDPDDPVVTYEGYLTSSEYDALGNVVSVTNALGDTTTYEYDSHNQLVKKTLPDPDGEGELTSPVTTYRYDAAGNLVAVTDARADADLHSQSVVPLDGIVANWKLNDVTVSTTTTTVDSSGNDKDATLFNIDSGNLTDGINGKAMSFNGSDEYATMEYLDVNTETNGKNTVSFWMKWSGGSSWQMPFSWYQDGATNDGYALAIYDSKIGFYGDTDTHLRSNSAIPVDEWIHIIAVFNNGTVDDSTCKLYIDGQLQELSLLGSTPVGSKDVSNAARLSGWNSNTSYKYGGVLDEVLIFNRELSASEIAALADTGEVYTTWYDYDALGRQTHVTDSLGDYSDDPDHTVTTTYDLAGNVISITDQLGRTTDYKYDKMGRLIEKILPDPDDPEGENRPTTYYGYDAAGNLVAVTDALGSELGDPDHTTYYRYDALGHQTHIIDALCSDPTAAEPDHTVVTEYDAVGNVEKVTDQLGNTTDYEYDNLGRLIEEILPAPTTGADRPTTYYGYDTVGNLVAVTDALGSELGDPDHTTWYRYDALGRQTHVIDALCTDPEATDPDHTVVTDYDAVGNVEKVTDQLGRTTDYEYDNLGQLTKEILPDPDNPEGDNRPTTYYEYDAVGNLTEMIAAGDSTLHMSGCIWKRIDFNYTVTADTIIEFDFRCLQEGAIHAIGLDSQYASANATRSMKVYGTQTWGNSTYDNYEASAPGWKHYTIPLGQYYTGEMYYLFFANDDDAANAAESYFRNVQVYEDGQTPAAPINFSEYTLDYYAETPGSGAEVVVEGDATYYRYDALGRQTHIIDALCSDPTAAEPDHTVVTAYDAVGNVEKVTDAEGNETKYGYDRLNRLTEETDPLGATLGAADHTTAYAYDALGRLVKKTDREGRIIAYAYDAVGRLAEERWYDNATDFDNDDRVQTTTRFYDAADQLLGVDDPSAMYQYEYDNLGQVVESRMLPHSLDILVEPFGTPFFVPDVDLTGNMSSPTGNEDWDGDGGTNENYCEHEYTWAAGDKVLIRLTSSDFDPVLIVDSPNSVRTIDTGSGADGNTYLLINVNVEESGIWKVRATSRDNVTSGEYHLEIIKNDNPFVPSAMVEFDYTYNAIGNLTQATDSYGGQIDYDYNALGVLKWVKQSQSGTTNYNKKVAFTYNDDGTLDTLTRYIGTEFNNLRGSSQYDYDRLGQLVDLVHRDNNDDVLVDYDWLYDAAGRITGMAADYTDGSLDDIDSDFGYDNTDQLTSADHDDLDNEDYAYDAAGNRTNTGYSTGTGNRLESDGVFNYEYDNEGNRTKRTRISGAPVDDYITEYVWDHNNRLTEVVFKNNSLEKTKVVYFTYDASGRRIKKQVDYNADDFIDLYYTNIYLGDELYLERFFEPLQPGESGPELPEQTSHRYLYGSAVDQLLAADSHEDIVWALEDHQGTIRDVVYNDEPTEIAEHRKFDSFGNLLDGDTLDMPQAFTGRPLDEDVGLYDYRARWYDPAAGRFLSETPLGISSDDINLYDFNANCPTGHPPVGGLSHLCRETSYINLYGVAPSMSSYAAENAINSYIHSLDFPFGAPSYSSLINTNLDAFESSLQSRSQRQNASLTAMAAWSYSNDPIDYWNNTSYSSPSSSVSDIWYTPPVSTPSNDISDIWYTPSLSTPTSSVSDIWYDSYSYSDTSTSYLDSLFSGIGSTIANTASNYVQSYVDTATSLYNAISTYDISHTVDQARIGLSNFNAFFTDHAQTSSNPYASEATALVNAITNAVLPSTDAGIHQMILNAGAPGESLRVNYGITQIFLEQTYLEDLRNNSKATYLQTMSSELYNQHVANSRDGAFDNIGVYPGTIVADTFQDLYNSMKGNALSIGVIQGHHHGPDLGRGVTAGAFTSITDTSTYVGGSNAATVGKAISERNLWLGDPVMVLSSCNLGNWTKMDTVNNPRSVVQTFSNALGGIVVSPAGYSSGQFVVNPNQANLYAVPRTEKYNGMYDYHSNPKLTEPQQKKRMRESYNSMRNTYYITFPKQN